MLEAWAPVPWAKSTAGRRRRLVKSILMMCVCTINHHYYGLPLVLLDIRDCLDHGCGLRGAPFSSKVTPPPTHPIGCAHAKTRFAMPMGAGSARRAAGARQQQASIGIPARGVGVALTRSGGTFCFNTF